MLNILFIDKNFVSKFNPEIVRLFKELRIELDVELIDVQSLHIILNKMCFSTTD